MTIIPLKLDRGDLIGLFQVKFQAGTHTNWSKLNFPPFFSGGQTSLLHGTNEKESWFDQTFKMDSV